MNETQAASSPAETVDVFQGQQPTVAEYDSYRKSGELPERFKPAEPAESAPADAPEETAEPDAPESDPEEAQEQPQKGSGAEKRIKQLLAEKKELQRKLEAAAKPTSTPDSSPARTQQQAQNFNEWSQNFDVDKWEEDYAKTHPNASFARMQLDQKLYVDGAKDHFKSIEQTKLEQQRYIQTAVAEGEALYGKDFGPIADETAGVIGKDPDIPMLVKQRFAKSSVLPHLTYVLGGDPEALADFVKTAKTDQFEALDRIAIIERGIREELAKPKETPVRGEDGKFTAPEKRQTSAPKPPSPVNGSSARAFDVNDESLSTDDWMKKRNKQLGKG